MTVKHRVTAIYRAIKYRFDSISFLKHVYMTKNISTVFQKARSSGALNWVLSKPESKAWQIVGVGEGGRVSYKDFIVNFEDNPLEVPRYSLVRIV